MAIFHLHAKIISRGKGQSAIAAAAYRSGERLRDEQANEQKFYQTRAERIEFTEILVPKHAPAWAQDRNALWNQAEQAEKRKDAQLAREIELSLPHEMTDQQRQWLAKDFAREQFVRKGYAVDIAIHAPDKDSDKRNYHAHLMVTMRTLGPDGFAVKKDPAMNRREQLQEWRQQFAHLTNRHLERHGIQARVDHRSLEAQGIEREATVHVGYAGNEIAARGGQSDRIDGLRAVLARNEIRLDMRTLEAELKTLESEQAKQEKQAAAAKAAECQQAAQKPAPAALSQPRIVDTLTPEELARRNEVQLKMEAVFRADMKALDDPAGKAFIEKAREAARDMGQEARTERRETAFWARQEEWYASRRLPLEPTAPPAPKKSMGLQVVDRVTGVAMQLTDYVTDLLAGGSSAPKQPADMKAFVNDPAARKQHQLARLAAVQQEREAAAALERIAEDMQKGKALNAQDIRKLTHQHQEQIRTFGDDAVRQMVDESRKRSEQYWKGNERERER
jgi:ATP-dependent exoDNAse (exonuclease V) alpha subunit